MDLPAARSPFRASWLRTWLTTAAVGTSFLALIFGGYETLERLLLRPRYPSEVLALFHVGRGIAAAVVLGTWAFYNIWRTRRQYDRAFHQAYARLRQEMSERSRDLARAQRFNERLFDALQDRLLVLDRGGLVVKANRVASEAAGAPLEGHPCALLSGSCSIEDADCPARQAFARGHPVLHAYERTDSRSGRMFSVDAYPVPDTDGSCALVILAARDITEQKQLEAQVRHQEKMAAIGVLAAGIAHDLGNPLASLSSELEMMQAETDLGRVRESVSVLRRLVQRMARILRDMTDFARRRGEEATTLSVNVAVHDALRLVGHDPRARGVRVVTELPEDLPTIRMVEDHLVMVITNLLLNAYDAMPDGGTLTIRAAQRDGAVVIELADTGTGMSEEVRRRAVEPLFTTKAGGCGTGLGLAVCVRALQSVGGALDIDSRPGRGTSVRLTLPAPAAALEAAHG